MDERMAALSDSLRRYIGAHPLAADSETGVRQWWLRCLGFEASPGEVRAALDVLIGDGVVRRQKLSSGVEVYSARRATED